MANAGIVCDDVIEQRLDVKDLIQCKRVCKSWYSLISSRYFVQLQLNYSLNYDHHHLKLQHGHRRKLRHRHRRIARLPARCHEEDNFTNYFRFRSSILGSSNGLVCQIYHEQRCCAVTNPLTAQFRKVPPLPCGNNFYDYFYAFGFGYDPCIDDYKVIAAVVERNDEPPEESLDVPTEFYVFTLNAPSEAWGFIGQVNYWYTADSRYGVLCDGALHWFVKTCQHNRKVILSLDLSTEEFKEIPQPNLDDGYEPNDNHRLGVLQGCLCIYSIYQSSSSNKWFYNKQHSWELFPCDKEIRNVVHYLINNDELCSSMSVSTSWYYLRAPIFVQSLVSPHDNYNNNIMGRATLVSPHFVDAPTTKNKVRRRKSRDGLKGVLLGWLRRWLQFDKQGRDKKESRGRVLACFSLNF